MFKVTYESCYFGIWDTVTKVVNRSQLIELENTVGIAVLKAEEIS